MEDIMKRIIIALAALLPFVAQAQTAASFTWQGTTFANPQFTLIDADNVRVSGLGASGKTAIVPFSKLPASVQQQLIARRDLELKSVRELSGTVVGLLPGGLLIDTTKISITTNAVGRPEETVTPGEIQFLRGHPDQATLGDGNRVAVHAILDGSFTYTTPLGARLTVTAFHYKGPLPSSLPSSVGRTPSPATPRLFGPGSKMQGTNSLDPRR
jgi:hypothetical protein